MATRVEFISSAVANLFAGTPSSSGTPVSIAGTASVGDFIAVYIFTENTFRTYVSVTGTGSTSYSLVTGTPPFGASGSCQVAWGIAADANAGKGIVVTMSGNISDDSLIAVARYTGLDATQAGLSQNSNVQNPGTPNVSGNVTPANATGVTFGLQMRTGTSWTDDSNFVTETTGSARYWIGYRNNAPASAFQFSNTEASGNRDSSSRIVAFQGASGGGGSGILIGGTLVGGSLLGVLA